MLQFEWSVLEKPADFPGAFLIHHRVISGATDAMRKIFERDDALCRRWSNAVDVNLADPKILARVLLQAALASNPNGMVLFSSRVPAHIRANVRATEETESTARGKRFLELIAAERK